MTLLEERPAPPPTPPERRGHAHTRDVDGPGWC